MDIHILLHRMRGGNLCRGILPFLSRLFSEPRYGILPAAIASVVGGMLVSHYSYLSVAAPVAAVGTRAGAEMMQMVHDEHAIITSYLQKYTEVRQQVDLAAEQEMLKSKAAEHTAMLAEREAKVAETRALAVVVQVAEKPGRKVAAKRPMHELDTMAVGEPLQLIAVASSAPQNQPVVQPTAPPVRLVRAHSMSLPPFVRRSAKGSIDRPKNT
jgi:hypothetical protein